MFHRLLSGLGIHLFTVAEEEVRMPGIERFDSIQGEGRLWAGRPPSCPAAGCTFVARNVQQRTEASPGIVEVAGDIEADATTGWSDPGKCSCCWN